MAKTLVQLGTVGFHLYRPSDAIVERYPSDSGFSQWLNQHGIMFEDTGKPSLAALQLFQCQKSSRFLTISLSAQRDSSIVIAELELELEIPDRLPRQVSRGSRALCFLFWHYFNIQRSNSECEGANHVDVSGSAPCGIVGCDGSCLPGNVLKSEVRFHLDEVFEACTRESVEQNDDDTTGEFERNCRLGENDAISVLPRDIHFRILKYLSPMDISSLSQTNKTFYGATKDCVPGLKLSLFRHQRVGVNRMRKMEQISEKRLPLPLVEEIKISVPHVHCVVDMCSGSLLLLPSIPMVSPPRGGLMCDEPGLGKTITGLSLILKTLNHRSEPPPGIEKDFVSVVHKGKEARLSCYFHYTSSRYKAGGGQAVEQFVSRQSRIMHISDSGNEDSEESLTRPSKRARVIVRPDFFDQRKGRGSVPTLSEAKTAIYLSSTTLVLAPRTLVKHWVKQIKSHVAPNLLRIRLVTNSRELPSPESIVLDYDVIIMSFKMLNSVHRKMRFSVPSLMRVRFLRIIIDEGHSLGSSGQSLTEFSMVSSSLNAERRWIMTGTPTPSTPMSDVRYLHPLLQFIRDEMYGLDRDAWVWGIQKPYESFQVQSLSRLKSLLRMIMIRTSKAALFNIPDLSITDKKLEFSESSAKVYNDLVTVVTRNLITSDWFKEDHEESLLNPKNRRQASLVMENLRHACCFGGIIRLTVEPSDLVETLEKLYYISRHRADGALRMIRTKDREQTVDLEFGEVFEPPPDYARTYLYKNNLPPVTSATDGKVGCVEEVVLEEHNNDLVTSIIPVYRKGNDQRQRRLPTLRMNYRGHLGTIARSFEDGCECEACSLETRMPFVTPCAHLVCNLCILSDRKKCPVRGCCTRYALDNDGIPEELIELQPAMNNYTWKTDWDGDLAESRKMEYLIQRLLEMPHSIETRDGKSVYRRKKVIIYSQFSNHLLLAAYTFKKHAVLKNHYVELFTNEREILYGSRSKDLVADDVLHEFESDPEKFILLMGTARGSVGLDLSFVEYIFLLEPVWDSALEKQVISRAHRMGAKNTIRVERLAMTGSIEDKMLKDISEARRVNPMKSGVGKEKEHQNYERMKAHLLHLDYVSLEGKARNGRAVYENHSQTNTPEGNGYIGRLNAMARASVVNGRTSEEPHRERHKSNPPRVRFDF